MNRMRALLPVLFLALWSCSQQPRVGLDDCNSASSSPDQRIGACTRLIDSGQLSLQDRATAFHSRGVAWADKRYPDRAIADYNEALHINPLYALAYIHRFVAQQKQHGTAGSNSGSTPPLPPPSTANPKGEADSRKQDNASSNAGSIPPPPSPPTVNPKDAADYSRRGDVTPNAASSTAPPPPPTADPKDATGYNKRGIAWAEKRDYDRAIADYNEALRLNPRYAFAYYNRGNAWRTKRDYDRALADYSEALRIDPQYAFAYYNRGNVWNDKGDYSRALADYNEALRINPKAAGIYNSAAWLLATAPVAAVRNGARAVELARKATELSNSKDADMLDTLAAAYAEAGVFSEAIRWQEKSLEFPEFAKTQGDTARKRIELYRKGQPYHRSAKP